MIEDSMRTSRSTRHRGVAAVVRRGAPAGAVTSMPVIGGGIDALAGRRPRQEAQEASEAAATVLQRGLCDGTGGKPCGGRDDCQCYLAASGGNVCASSLQSSLEESCGRTGTARVGMSVSRVVRRAAVATCASARRPATSSAPRHNQGGAPDALRAAPVLGRAVDLAARAPHGRQAPAAVHSAATGAVAIASGDPTGMLPVPWHAGQCGSSQPVPVQDAYRRDRGGTP